MGPAGRKKAMDCETWQRIMRVNHHPTDKSRHVFLLATRCNVAWHGVMHAACNSVTTVCFITSGTEHLLYAPHQGLIPHQFDLVGVCGNVPAARKCEKFHRNLLTFQSVVQLETLCMQFASKFSDGERPDTRNCREQTTECKRWWRHGGCI